MGHIHNSHTIRRTLTWKSFIMDLHDKIAKHEEAMKRARDRIKQVSVNRFRSSLLDCVSQSITWSLIKYDNVLCYIWRIISKWSRRFPLFERGIIDFHNEREIQIRYNEKVHFRSNRNNNLHLGFETEFHCVHRKIPLRFHSVFTDSLHHECTNSQIEKYGIS